MFFEKIKHLQSMQLLCSLNWHQYHFATITHFSMIFFHPSRGFHWCSTKTLREFLEHPSISISEKQLQDFGKLPSKASILESSVQVHLQASWACETPLTSRGSCLF